MYCVVRSLFGSFFHSINACIYGSFSTPISIQWIVAAAAATACQLPAHVISLYKNSIRLSLLVINNKSLRIPTFPYKYFHWSNHKIYYIILYFMEDRRIIMRRKGNNHNENPIVNMEIMKNIILLFIRLLCVCVCVLSK